MFAQGAAVSWAEGQWATSPIGHCRRPVSCRASCVRTVPIPPVGACLLWRRSARRDAGEDRMRHAACDRLEEVGSDSRGRPSSRSNLLLFLMISPSSWSALPSSVNGT